MSYSETKNSLWSSAVNTLLSVFQSSSPTHANADVLPINLFPPTDMQAASEYSIGGGGGPLKGLTQDAMYGALCAYQEDINQGISTAKSLGCGTTEYVGQSLGISVAARVAIQVYGQDSIKSFRPIAHAMDKVFVLQCSKNLGKVDFTEVANEAVVLAVECYFPRIIRNNLQQLVAQHLEPFHQKLSSSDTIEKINIAFNVAKRTLQHCCQLMPSYYPRFTNITDEEASRDIDAGIPLQDEYMLSLPASDGINQSERQSFARAAAAAEENPQGLDVRHDLPPLPTSSLVPRSSPTPEDPKDKAQPPQEDDCFNTLGVIVGLVALFICAAEFSSFPWKGYDNVQELLVHLVQKEWVFMLVVVAAVMLMAVAMMPNMTCSSAPKLD